MIVALIKFIHVFIAMSILGCAITGFVKVSGKHLTSFKLAQCHKLNKIILSLLLCGMILGTALVYPKHYTFHTPWIQAAYLFIAIVILMLGFLRYLIKRQMVKTRIFWQLAYGLLIMMIGFVIRDAVMKSTWLF